MNENLYIAHKKIPHKTLRVHSASVMGIQSACVRVMLRDQDLCETESRWMSWAPVPNKPMVSVE